MKLVFLNGKKTGENFEIQPPGISIGRETDNDVSSLEPGLSRYHAKIEWVNNCWLIKDLGSTNGVKINGRKITEPSPLKDGDKITLGNQVFQFGTTGGAEAANPAAPPAPAANFTPQPPSAGSPPPAENNPTPTHETGQDKDNQDANAFWDKVKNKKDEEGKDKPGNLLDDFDLFGGKVAGDGRAPEPGKDGRKRTVSNLLFYVVVIGLAVIAVSLFLILEKNGGAKTAPDQAKAQAKELPLMLFYRKEISTADNIFRYSLKIENGSVFVTLDDLKHKRHLSKPFPVSEEQLQSLLDSLRQTKFMDLIQESAGVSADGVEKERTLVVGYGKNLNKITIKNTFAPNSFEEVEAAVESFSAEQLGVRSLVLTVKEMQDEAERSFTKAEELFQNNAARPENLNESLKRYKIAMEMLEVFTPKPEIWDLARKKVQEAQAMLDKQIRDHNFNAEQSFRLKDYQNARNQYAMITRMLDPEDERHRKARDNMIKLDSLLRKLRKK